MEEKKKTPEKKEDPKSILERREQYLNRASAPLLKMEFHYAQQKEEQVAINVAFQVERTDRKEEVDETKEKILDKTAFIKFFAAEGHTLIPQTVNEKDPAIIWDNLFGNITPSDGKNLNFAAGIGLNPLANKMTEDAARCILAHYDEFSAGIDFYHLPPGFKLRGETLFFSSQLMLEELPAPRLYIRLSNKESKETKKEEKQHGTQPDITQFTRFGKNKREKSIIEEWWKSLYKSHAAHFPSHQIKDLVACFENFLTHIYVTLKLQLPASPPLKSKNLFVTLGHIVSLIEHCAPENRQAQLDLVPELSFRGKDVIRALDIKKSKPNYCRFVHPAMGYEENQFVFEGGNGYSSMVVENRSFEYYTKDDFHYITRVGRDLPPTQRLARVRQAFWRFVGHREAFSLPFYLEAEKEIQKYEDPEAQRLFYGLLAAVSTEVALALGKISTQEATEWWKGFCKFCKKMGNPIMSLNSYLEAMEYNNRVLPPIPVFKKIISLIEKAMQNQNSMSLSRDYLMDARGGDPLDRKPNLRAYKALEEFGHILFSACLRASALSEYSLLGIQAVCDGMRFCDQPNISEIKERGDPFSFLDKLHKIENTDSLEREKWDAIEKTGYVFLLRSFDTFRLSVEEIEEIYYQIRTLEKRPKNLFTAACEKLRAEGLSEWAIGSPAMEIEASVGESHPLFIAKVFYLLENIHNRDGLSKNSLLNIFDKTKEIAKDLNYPDLNARIRAMIDFLQERYQDNFPHGFLYQQKLIYSGKQLSPAIISQIDKNFKNEEQAKLVKNLLLEHNTEAESVQAKTVDLLHLLASSYSYDNTAFNEWLYQIIQYEQSPLSSHSLADLNQVFLFITTEHNPLLLETLMYREDRDKIPQLIQKCPFLQETLYPWLKENSNRLSQESTYSAMVEVSIPIDPTKLDDTLDSKSLLKAKENTETDELDSKSLPKAKKNKEADELVDRLDELLQDSSENREEINATVKELLGKKTYQSEMALWEAWKLLKDSKPSEEFPFANPSLLEKKLTPTEEKEINVHKDDDTREKKSLEKSALTSESIKNDFSTFVLPTLTGFFLWKSLQGSMLSKESPLPDPVPSLSEEEGTQPTERKKEKKINVDQDDDVPEKKNAKKDVPVSQNVEGALNGVKGIFVRSMLNTSKAPQETKKNSAPVNTFPEKKSELVKDQKKVQEPPEISLFDTIVDLFNTEPEEQLKEQVKDKKYEDILKEFVEIEKKRRTSYKRFFLDYYERMYQFVEAHPSIKKDLLSYISHFAKKYAPTKKIPDEKEKDSKGQHLEYVRALRQQTLCLEEAAKNLNDLELRGLLYSYQQKEANPQALIDTLSNIEAVKDTASKKALYKLFAKFSGENILEPNALSKLCELADSRRDIFAAVVACYDNPPYIPLTTVLSWAENPSEVSVLSENKTVRPEEALVAVAKGEPSSVPPEFGSHLQTIETQSEVKGIPTFSPVENIRKKYKDKDKEPFPRENENIFNTRAAKKQAKLFQGTEVFKNDNAIEASVNELADQIDIYRGMSTSAKIAALTQFKIDNPPGDVKDRKSLTSKVTAQLTALLGELLYATSNQELNYTQYLTLYSSLSSEGSDTYQVVTGGGKSRITMALCAGLHLLGKTVDIITKNWDLAEREFYKNGNRQFFQACEIPIQLVNVHTPADEYLNNNSGINFSSKHQLGLFHNQVCSEGREDIFSEGIDNRVLVADEADLLYYENGREHVILSRPLRDEKLGDLSWIYPWLMKFIERDEFTTEYLNEDIDLIYRSFRHWMQTFHLLPKEQLESVNKIQDSQLEVWFRSAIQVRDKLEEGREFDGVIGRDRPKQTHHGLRLVSAAVVKADNAPAWESTYSDGVQQLLNVRLNNKRNRDRADGLAVSRTPYEVEEECFAIYSSTMSTLLSRYGTIKGFTGTAGSIDKRHELSKYNMRFVDVPPHHPSQRIDLPMRLAADEREQMEFLYQDIVEARRDHRPVLVICEDDNESAKFHRFCIEAKGLPVDKVKRVDGAFDMKEATKKAGQDSMVTITTDIMGRGTDIELDKNGRGKEKGLRGLCTYLPEEDDGIQIFGRVARNGKPGDFRMVPTIERLKARLGIPADTQLSDDTLLELSLNREAFIRYHQNKLDWDKQDVRAVYQRVNTLNDDITRHFFDTLKKESEQSKKVIIAEWVSFNKQLKDDLLTPALDTINRLLRDKKSGYQKDIIDQLEACMPATASRYCQFFYKAFKVETAFGQFKPKKEDMNALKAQLVAPRIKIPYQSKTCEKWHPEHAGQNVTYHKPFRHTRAVLAGETSSWTQLFWRTDHRRAHERGVGVTSPEYTAWAHNERLLFANTRAWLAGDLNKERKQLNQAMRALYATLLTHPNYRASVEQLLHEISRLSLGADKKMFELFIKTVNATTKFINEPGKNKAEFEGVMAEMKKDRRFERLYEISFLLGSLALTYICAEVSTMALTLDMPHVMSFNFSLIQSDIALKLSLAGASVGCLLAIMYVIKTFAPHTGGLQTAMESVEKPRSVVPAAV